jgi:hypothetical protein
MTDNTLDAAIKVAHVEAGFGEAFQILPANQEYARALIAKLLEGMERRESTVTWSDFDDGYNAALTDIRRRAGLEDKA